MGLSMGFLFISSHQHLFHDHIEISSTSIEIGVLHNIPQNTFHRRSCNHDLSYSGHRGFRKEDFESSCPNPHPLALSNCSPNCHSQCSHLREGWRDWNQDTLGCLRPDVHLHSSILLPGIPCPSSKTSLPRHHRTHHHLRLNLLLRHGHRRRKLLRPHRRQGSPQAHPRHRGAHLPSGLLGPLRRLGTHHSSSPPRPCFPRRHERRQHHRHHRR